ncbi:MAG: hypothetical protein QOE95_2250, partial [Gaiellaceae bacterium]|nr:hypothetical protein [Gaiellaceae bacterium]
SLPGRASRVAVAHARWAGSMEVAVVILGVILLLIGLFASLSILLWLGLVLIVVGLVLNFVPIGGTRRRYY